MTEKIKQIIGYYKESIDHFLCNDCFLKLNNLKKEDCNTITEDDLIKDVYICDACKKEIGINEKNYINNQQDEKFKKQEEIKEEKKPEIKSFKFYWLTPGTPKQIAYRGLISIIIGVAIPLIGLFGFFNLIEALIVFIINKVKNKKKN